MFWIIFVNDYVGDIFGEVLTYVIDDLSSATAGQLDPLIIGRYMTVIHSCKCPGS